MKHLCNLLNEERQMNLFAEEILNAFPLACYLLDKDLQLVCLNRKMETLLQKNNEEKLGRKIRDILQDDVPDTYYDVLNTALTLRRTSSYKYYSKISEDWILLKIVPIMDGILVSYEEMDDFIEREQLLAMERQKLNEAQLIANLGSYTFDAQSNRVIWSDQTYRIMGLEIGEPIDFEKAIAIYKPSDAEKLIGLIKKALLDGEGFEMDAIIHGGSAAEEKYIYIKAEAVRDLKQKITGIRGVVQDITAIKQAEQKNLEDSAMINGIADAAPDMLYVIDFRQMRMVYANNNVLRLFGRTLKELYEMGPALFDQVVYPSDRVAFDAHMAALLVARDGEIKELTFRLIDAKGNPKWVKTRRTIYRRDKTGAPTHAVSISQDISEQMRLQEENRKLELQKKEMESTMQKRIFQLTLDVQEQERKRIAESIHNGLGQLLYGVKLNLSRIRLDKHVQLNGDYMAALKHAQELLADAIRESRKISYELTPTVLENFGLVAAIEEMSSNFREIVFFKCVFSGLEERFENSHEIAAYRIAQELMLNVVKHARATIGEVSLRRTEREIYIQVKDNGIGFNEINRRITGMGLINIKNKISLLKGRLDISSASGQDTVVSVILPLFY